MKKRVYIKQREEEEKKERKKEKQDGFKGDQHLVTSYLAPD